MGDLSESIYDLDLVYRVYRGRETTVYAEDLVVDDHTESKVVEHVGKIMPDVGITVLPRTLSVKAIGLRNASRFVVPADEVDSLRVSELQTYEKCDSLDAEEPSIDIVTCHMRQRVFRAGTCHAVGSAPRKR